MTNNITILRKANPLEKDHDAYVMGKVQHRILTNRSAEARIKDEWDWFMKSKPDSDSL